jgi:hypothetical protein
VQPWLSDTIDPTFFLANVDNNVDNIGPMYSMEHTPSAPLPAPLGMTGEYTTRVPLEYSPIHVNTGGAATFEAQA